MLLDHTSGIFDQTNNLDILDDIALLTDPAQIAAADDLAARYLAGEDVIVPDRLLVALAEAHGRDFPAGTEYRYVSTAGELATIMQAIVAGDLLEPSLLDEMRTPTELSDGTYGLGLGRYGLTCGTFYGHEGGVNGTASIALVSDDGTDVIVVALNLRDGSDPNMPALADDLLCPALRAD